MLPTVPGSPRFVKVTIDVLRSFVRVRALAATHCVLAKRLAEFEGQNKAPAMSHHTFSRNTRNQLREVFDALHELMTPADPPKRPIQFGTPEDKVKRGKGEENP